MNLDLTEYKKISRIIFLSFFVSLGCIVIIHLQPIDGDLVALLGKISRLAIDQFFYGTIGATIACSIFLSKDKDTNIIESRQVKPDPIKLQLPDELDKWLYLQRIVSSGILAIFGMFLTMLTFI